MSSCQTPAVVSSYRRRPYGLRLPRTGGRRAGWHGWHGVLRVVGTVTTYIPTRCSEENGTPVCTIYPTTAFLAWDWLDRQKARFCFRPRLVPGNVEDAAAAYRREPSRVAVVMMLNDAPHPRNTRLVGDDAEMDD